MASFTAYYWFDRGDKGRSVCETISASSLDEATRRVEERLRQPYFSFNSSQDGHVVVQTGHVQYVEVESDRDSSCGDEDDDRTNTPDIF